MALSAELNLFTFGAQRRQATGVGLYLITEVLLNISSGGLCVRVKDERVVVQQQPGALLACEASPHSERGMRKVLTFAGGGRPRETAVPLRIDLELQSDADAALLQHVCDALLVKPSRSLGALARGAVACGLTGADGAVLLKRGELQRHKRGWQHAVLIPGKLFLFAPRTAALHDDGALQRCAPRHVISLALATITGAGGSRHVDVQPQHRDTPVRLVAPTWAEAQEWRAALQAAQLPALASWPTTPVLHPAQDAPRRRDTSSDGDAGGAAAQPEALLPDVAEQEGELALAVQQTPRQPMAPPAVVTAAGEPCAHADDVSAAASSDDGSATPAPASPVADHESERKAALRAAIEQHVTWVPRSTHDQVEDFLLRFPDVTRADAYDLCAQFDAFDISRAGALEVDAAMRLLEARRETRTFRELRHMIEDVHIQASAMQPLSFLEWACTVFHKSWLDVCMHEAARAAVSNGDGAPAADQARERQARYEAQRAAAEAAERENAEREMREHAERRMELRKRTERFERRD